MRRVRYAVPTAVMAGLLCLAVGPAHGAGGAARVPVVPLVLAATSVDEMNPEMRVAYIRGIQEELAAHGYAPGPADGILGPRTRGAIRTYQRDAGLPVDGRATKELLDHLKFAVPRVTAKPKPPPDPLVLEVQRHLGALGYYRGAHDGLMGPLTREAIRAYRADVGLPVSGAADAALLDSLRAEAEAEGAPALDLPESVDRPASAEPPEGLEGPEAIAVPPEPEAVPAPGELPSGE